MRTRTVDPIMVEFRAADLAKRSIKKSAKLAGLKLALSMVDLTTLEGKDSPEKVRSLCLKALRPMADDESLLGERLPSVGAICVYPTMVATVRDELERIGGRNPRDAHGVGGIKIASVATAFPSGQAPLGVKVADTESAIEAGADEVDMVISRGQFLAGNHDEVASEIREIQSICVARGAHLKVILETGELETYDRVRAASDLAIQAMADAVGEGGGGDVKGGFIKTSTGKVSPAATMPVTLVMLEAIRDHFLATGHMVGMKPAGGIRTSKQALAYLAMVKETLGDAWLTNERFRFGASSLGNDLLRQITKEKLGRYAAAHDFAEA